MQVVHNHALDCMPSAVYACTMSMQGDPNPVANLGRNFGGAGTTWTFAKGTASVNGELRECIVVVVELASGTIGFTLTLDDARRFAEMLRTTSLGLTIVGNGDVTPAAG